MAFCTLSLRISSALLSPPPTLPGLPGLPTVLPFLFSASDFGTPALCLYLFSPGAPRIPTVLPLSSASPTLGTLTLSFLLHSSKTPDLKLAGSFWPDSDLMSFLLSAPTPSPLMNFFVRRSHRREEARWRSASAGVPSVSPFPETSYWACAACETNESPAVRA